MSIWDTYQNRADVHGTTKRKSSYKREIRFINRKITDSLSYQDVIIYPKEYGFNVTDENISRHCERRNVAIINSDNLNEKMMISMPEEDIRLGSLVHWMDNYWLAIERDANTTLYTRTKLMQCNHLLKWITPQHEIIEQWCIVEDGTKYLTGELEDRTFFTTRGDSRISVQLAKNLYTNVLDRSCRFLIDDEDSPHKLAYQLTKPLKKGMVFNGDGTFKFVLQEVTGTENDNHDLGIADYYLHFPDELPDEPNPPTETDENEGKKVWI